MFISLNLNHWNHQDYYLCNHTLDENSDIIFPSLWEKRWCLHLTYFSMTLLQLRMWIAQVITLCVTQRKKRKLGLFCSFFSIYLHIFFGIHCQPNSIHVLLNYINNNRIVNNVITNFILIKHTIYISFIVMIVYCL